MKQHERWRELSIRALDIGHVRAKLPPEMLRLPTKVLVLKAPSESKGIEQEKIDLEMVR